MSVCLPVPHLLRHLWTSCHGVQTDRCAVESQAGNPIGSALVFQIAVSAFLFVER